MNDKKAHFSHSDLKKWGLFLLFLLALVVVYIFLLKPGGEEEARSLIQEARVLVQEARGISQKSKAPHDLADMDISGEALAKAESYLIESDFQAAIQEAQKSILHARKVVQRGMTGGQVRNQLRFRHISGAVLIKKNDSRDFQRATDKMPLEEGDTIKTSEQGACLLGYSSRMETTIHPGSLVTIQDSFSNGDPNDSLLDLYLEQGSLTMKTSELQQTGKAGVFTDSGRTTIFPNSEALVGFVQNTGNTEIMVRLGRVDAMLGSNQVSLGRNQFIELVQGKSAVQPVDLPPPPELLEPNNFSKFEANQNGFASITLNWAPVPEAEAYFLEISTDKLFTTNEREKNNFAGNTYELPDLQKGIYYWRISSIGKNRVLGVTSQMRQFQVGEVDLGSSHNVDESPPVLKITKTAVQGYIVIIRGKSERDADVTVEGENAIIDEFTGDFSYTASMPGKGTYKIHVVATDRAGNRAHIAIPVEIKD